MTKTLIFFLLFASTLTAQVQTAAPQKLNVAVFIYPGVGLGDLDGPVDVFTKASGMTKGQYHVYTVAFKSDRVITQNGGLKITPDHTIDQMPQPDILVLPGGSIGLLDSMRRDPAVVKFIQEQDPKVKVMLPICTAVYIAGQAGLLDGHRSTTHYFLADDLQNQFPKTSVVHDVRFVDEGHLVTASGVTSGIDAALHLVEKYSGARVAKMVEGAIQYAMQEKGAWPQSVDGMKFDRERRKKMGLLAP